jgi:hypothetical protein
MPVSVTVNVPGVNGTSFARAEDFPLVMQVPKYVIFFRLWFHIVVLMFFNQHDSLCRRSCVYIPF